MRKMEKIFGELTFNKKVMREKLNRDVYDKLIATIESGDPLDQAIASDVAHAMKDWALQNGATHFTHWFQPQRGGTAEKHDAFIIYDENQELLERFSASKLIQSEPDASSFPSGGMRSTFEARGYTAWDPTSQAFLLESKKSKTLVIPSIYLSWTGEVLDLKTPFLRSQKVLNEAAIKMQKLLGNRFAKRVKVFLGLEQEYFLIPKDMYNKRLDLKNCGRTLFGAPPAKGQQMNDHYFGSINDRVLAFMEDLDRELYRRGIPSKTRHNEVAPNQFEIAPLYEEANLAIDHNLQMMEIIRRIADEHNLVALFHEKPFTGLNGSGKHMNWSMGDNTGLNYLEPSKSPLKNITFLMTVSAIMLGVARYGNLLRMAVADAGNDHRLGAHEAPPAIMSVYLGQYLDQLLNEIEGTGKLTEKVMAHINLDIQKLPRVAKDSSDRNRTAPIAFTGNKFEFRAVGSNQNCSEAAMIFNLIVANGFNEIYSRLKDRKGDIKHNSFQVLKEVIKETKFVRFEGNCYSKEWEREAQKRLLPNAKNTPQALEALTEKDSENLFTKHGIFSPKELSSKLEIKLDAFLNIKKIEYKTAVELSRTCFLPAVAQNVKQISDTALNLKTLGISNSPINEELNLYLELYEMIKIRTEKLRSSLLECENLEDLHMRSHQYVEMVEPDLNELRGAVDRAEKFMAEQSWPLPKYNDMLQRL